jgi:hypothetical protein
MRRSIVICVCHQYYYGDPTKENEMVEHVRKIKQKKNSYKVVIKKPEGKRFLVKPRRRWIYCDVYTHC